MEEEKEFFKNWKGNVAFIVPVQLYKDRTLTALDRELYCWINTLSTQKGYCWATTKTFLEILNIKSNKTIQDSLKKLEENGYIIRKNYYDRKREKSFRIIYTRQKIEEEKINRELESHKKVEFTISKMEEEILNYDWINNG